MWMVIRKTNARTRVHRKYSFPLEFYLNLNWILQVLTMLADFTVHWFKLFTCVGKVSANIIHFNEWKQHTEAWRFLFILGCSLASLGRGGVIHRWFCIQTQCYVRRWFSCSLTTAAAISAAPGCAAWPLTHLCELPSKCTPDLRTFLFRSGTILLKKINTFLFLVQ